MADDNAILAEDGSISQLIGWVTLQNDTGISYENCHLKLIAGDVNRVRSNLSRSSNEAERVVVTGSNISTADERGGPAIERRAFDEYHEFLVPIPVTLSDREVTQLELVRATNINTRRSFIYDGSIEQVDVGGLNDAQLDTAFATDSTSKVAITSEFKNDAANHLGIPLPQGQVHFYRNDADGNLQFTGGSKINNTPDGELVLATTGYAFDLVGERPQIDYRINEEEHAADESFEIKLRNHRKKATEVRVWEHPSRWRQWEITAKSHPFNKISQRTFEFTVPVPANGEAKITYTIRYTHLPRRRS